MAGRKELLSDPAYWFEGEQNELFRQVDGYMRREGINRSELADRLNVSKGYVTQILNGDFNFTLKKHIEICLAIGVVPEISYVSLKEVSKREERVIEATESTCRIRPMHYKNIMTNNFDDIVEVKVTVDKDYTSYQLAQPA